MTWATPPARMAYEVHGQRRDITTMEVQSAPKTTYKYMADRCKDLGVEVPDTYEAIEAE